MKVSRCSDAKSVPAAPLLSEAQMLKEEGVYETVHTGLDVRIIVLKHSGMTAVLWYDPHNGVLEPTNLRGCSLNYQKTNEKVCFELKAE